MSEFIEFSLYGGKVKGKFYPGSHRYYIDGNRPTGVTTIIGIKDKSMPLQVWQEGITLDHLNENITEGMSLESMCQVFEEAVIQYTIRKDEAANIGTTIHGWCEGYIKRALEIPGFEKLPDMPEQKEVQIGVNAFLDFTEAHKIQFRSSERIVYSLKHGYIGTMDIDADTDRGFCVLDLKSSNGLYNGVRLQTAAYLKAATEESGKAYAGRWAIRLAKETEAEYVTRMEKKNERRVKRGGKAWDFPPYRVFEAVYLDDQPGLIEEDFEAFLAAKKLYEWNTKAEETLKASIAQA